MVQLERVRDMIDKINMIKNSLLAGDFERCLRPQEFSSLSVFPSGRAVSPSRPFSRATRGLPIPNS